IWQSSSDGLYQLPLKSRCLPKESLMARTHRLSTIALAVCLASTGWAGPVFASDTETSSTDRAPAVSIPARTASAITLSASPLLKADRSPFTLTPEQLTSSAATFNTFESTAFAQRGYYRGRRSSNRGGAVAALMIGAAASITGSAILVYANRPECS